MPLSAEELLELVAPIRALVAVMGDDAGGGGNPVAISAADEVIERTRRLSRTLGHDHTADAEARAAVLAACGVYRNAAFAFRKLAGVTGQPDPQMASVVAALIEMGDHHVQTIDGGA